MVNIDKWKTFTKGANHPKSGRSSNITQNAAVRPKRYCTPQRLQASVSVLNDQIQDATVRKQAAGMAHSGGGATQKHLL